MRIFTFILLALACFAVYARPLDSCARSENVLWEGMRTYNGPADRAARIKDVISKGAIDANNVLTVAVWFGYDDIIKKSLTDRDLVREYGAQSLYLAASMGRLNEMSMLLDAGISPNAEVQGGFTPIYGAAEHGCVRAMQLLVDSGADVNHRANVRWTLLQDAVISKQFDAARFLIAHGYKTSKDEKKKIDTILRRMGMESKFEYIFGDMRRVRSSTDGPDKGDGGN